MRTTISAILVAFLGAVSVNPLAAAEIEIYRADSRKALVEGFFDGVSVDPRGHLALARQVNRLGSLEEPFIFAAAGHADGWVVGTGSSGKVLLVAADGTHRELATLPEPQVFAVAVADDGTVYAATSPAGKVYRIADDKVEEVFAPQAIYIWDLAVDGEGRLLVATGLPAQLHRLTADGDSELLYAARDVHLRSLLPRDDGSVLLGTAGQGLVLRWTEGGSVTTLHDGVPPEVVAMTAGDDGVVFAALLASEASQVNLAASLSNAKKDGGGEVTITVSETGQETVGSRSRGFDGARSQVVALLPGGGYDDVTSLDDQTIHSLLFDDGELWIGTGEEGRLYRRQGDGVVEERQLDERQIVALAVGGNGAAALTANASAVYALKSAAVAEGTYTSKILDMDQVARFGSFQWQGEAPKGTSIELDFRSGLSSSPDATWSPWRGVSCGENCDQAGRRREISLSQVPNGRFVQWRAKFKGKGGRSPRLEMVELSYRQENRRPRLSAVEVLAPGEILVPSTFNAQNQAYEPWSPNRESIFTTLKADEKKDTNHLKTLWKRGYRTLKWKGEDANGDDLTYSLDVRLQGTADPSEDSWMTVAEDLDKTYLSFDSTVLPDGIYHFRVRATDSASRDAEEALETRHETSPVVVDHAAPQWVRAEALDGMIEIEVRDALSPLRQAVYSVDAGPWNTASSVDGLLDGRRETLRLPIAGTPRVLLLRLTDAAHNVVTFNVLTKVQGLSKARGAGR